MSFNNGPTIVTNGLVLALDAGDRNSYVSGSTTWFDLSGNGTSGSLINGPILDSSSFNYLVLDGTNDKIGLGDYGQRNNQIFYTSSLLEFTAEIVFRVDGLASNPGSLSSGFQSIYRVDAWTKSTLEYSNSSGSLRFIIGYDTPSDLLTGSIAIITGSWYYGTLVFKKTERQEIYLNGNLYASRTPTVSSTYGGASSTQATGESAAFNIGMGHPAPYTTYFKGGVALFRWYNKALTPSEVLQNYNATKGRFGL